MASQERFLMTNLLLLVTGCGTSVPSDTRLRCLVWPSEWQAWRVSWTRESLQLQVCVVPRMSWLLHGTYGDSFQISVNSYKQKKHNRYVYKHTGLTECPENMCQANPRPAFTVWVTMAPGTRPLLYMAYGGLELVKNKMKQQKAPRDLFGVHVL